MSDRYAAAALRLDEAIGTIRELALDTGSADTLMLVCADHGGGGAVINDHESAHPLDRTIPIIMAGAGARAGSRLIDATLLDIPATILAALRIRRPASYAGRAMLEAGHGMEHAA